MLPDLAACVLDLCDLVLAARFLPLVAEIPNQPRAAVAMPPIAIAIALTASISSRADLNHSPNVCSLTATVILWE